MGKMLFPEYLNQGSEGPAVAVLQLILVAAGLGYSSRTIVNEIIVDGQYGDVTAQAVRKLQRDLGVTEDGNFGPETREAVLKELGLNVNELSANLFVGETTAVTPT